MSRDQTTYIIEEDSDNDLVLMVKETLEELVLISVEKSSALIDCACPSTVTGRKWMDEFVNALSTKDKELIKVFDSEKVYKFGGGEKRKSLGKVIFPCYFAGCNLKMTTEVVDADFPLLLGNTILKKAQVVLYFGEGKAIVMGNEMSMQETESGHFSLPIEAPKADSAYVKSEINISTIESFLSTSEEPLSLKDIQKVHHYFGHIPRRRLEELINKSKKLTDQVKKHLD